MSRRRYHVTIAEEVRLVEIAEVGDGQFRVWVDGNELEVDARFPSTGPGSLLVGGTAYLVDVVEDGEDLLLGVGGWATRARVEDPRRRRRGRGGTAAAGQQRLVAPMPGRVVAVHVAPGARVETGAPLVVLEAMKMENEFRATGAGVVREVRVTPGQAVNAGDLLLVVEA
jgi:biotin carboxyl carrier protein